SRTCWTRRPTCPIACARCARAATTWCCSTSSIPTRSSCPTTRSPTSRAWSPRTRGGCWSTRAIWRRRSRANRRRCASAGGRPAWKRASSTGSRRPRSRRPKCCARSCSRASGRAGRTIAMHFLAPLLLIGLAAAVLPWIIHRIGRRRARPVRFAAMELLLRAEREVSARRRLRDVALLLARTGLVIALPLAFARPFAEVRSDLPAVTTHSQSAVIILDESASMRRRLHRDDTPFDVARARARDIVEHLSPDSDIALVLASEGSAAPVAELSGDRARVAAALASVAPSARRADFASALRRATQMLAGSPRGDRLIYVITDLQATGWEDVTPAALAAGPEIVVLDVSGGEPWTNRAVVGLGAEPAPEEGAHGIAVVAEIANYATEPVRGLGITLRLDGSEVARGFVDVPAAGRARKRFVHTVSGVAHHAEVVIDHDGFPLDDRRACRVEASRGLRVLVVNGDPRTVRTEDEAFFLEAAL